MNPSVRLIVVAGFAVAGAFLISADRELIGVLSLCLAVYFIGIDAYVPLLQLAAAALMSVVLTVLWWLPSSFSGVSLLEYIERNWFGPVLGFLVVLWIVWRQFSEADDTWRILQAEYSTPVPQLRPLCERAVSGYLAYQDERLHILSGLLESGIVLIRKNHRSMVHLPWERIARISVLDNGSARVSLKRSTMVPFDVCVPWASDFDEHVPSCAELMPKPRSKAPHESQS